MRIKHAVKLQRLFNNTGSGGFFKKDLGPHIFRSDSMYKRIFPTLSENQQPWNPHFIWQVKEFPVDVGEEAWMDDTVLAIAKDSEFCAVITISGDLKYIWYRMYKNDVHIPGPFGSLMYAYTQSEYDLYCREIFTLFDPDEQAKDHRQAELSRWGPPYTKMYMEYQKYVGDYNEEEDIMNFDLETYSASSVHKLDHQGKYFHTDEVTDDISVKDSDSEYAFKSEPDPRYPHLLHFEGPRHSLAGTDRWRESLVGRWYLDARELIADCMRRPTVREIKRFIPGDALVTEITQSVIRALATRSY